MKKIYLDVCTLCRPYDDQTFTRIHMETVALELILSAVEKKHFQLQWSPVHYQEISATANDAEREELLFLMEQTITTSDIDQQQARKRAETFVSYGIGVADAAHVAYAESMKADFITCDDKLFKKLAQVELPIWTGNPIAFCNKENLQ